MITVSDRCSMALKYLSNAHQVFSWKLASFYLRKMGLYCCHLVGDCNFAHPSNLTRSIRDPKLSSTQIQTAVTYISCKQLLQFAFACQCCDLTYSLRFAMCPWFMTSCMGLNLSNRVWLMWSKNFCKEFRNGRSGTLLLLLSLLTQK